MTDANKPRSVYNAGWRAAEEAWYKAIDAVAALRDHQKAPGDDEQLRALQLALAESESAAREATVQIRAARRAGSLPKETEEPTEGSGEKGS